MSTGRRRFIGQAAVFLGAALGARRVRSQTPATDFDYVIVGAGSSGCVLANRLSADPSVRVLLIEAGGPVVSPLAAAPGRWTALLGGELDWKYVTESAPALGGRRINWPRGKAYGGSSAINALAYARGHRSIFDGWARTVGAGWSYADLLPLFTRSERNTRGASDYHGASGPLVVADTTDPHAGHLAFLAAARELGFAASPTWDFDGPTQENGAGFYQKHIVNGRRQSVADAFLTPALTRTNLVVMSNAMATRVLFTGNRATGVEIARTGRLEQLHARREVIISAGAIESPKLLMLSGIGPGAALHAHGIRTVVDLPGVGANLHDHPRVVVRWESRQPLPGSSVSAGLLTSSRSRTSSDAPDVQFYVGRGLVDVEPFIALTVALTRPESRGAIALKSADPLAAPAIRAGYFDVGNDLDAMVEGVRLALALAGTRGYETLRGAPAGTPDLSTPEKIRAFIRASSDTMFHPAGTCRMGTDDSAVVDGALRVRGVDGLRVADASIMPTVVNCQCNAACVMIGEKAAEMIRGR